MSQDEKLKRTEDALKTLTDNQSILLVDTMKNLKDGSYWSLFTAKSFSDMFNVDFQDQKQMEEVRQDLSAIADVQAIQAADKSWHIIATYSNVEDFFTLFNLMSPESAGKIDTVKKKVYQEIQDNINTARSELGKIIEKAIKKSDPIAKVSIYSLNKSGKTKINNSEGVEVATIKSLSVDLKNFISLLDQVSSQYNVSYTFVNPVDGTPSRGIEGFAKANSSERGGIYTFVQFQ